MRKRATATRLAASAGVLVAVVALAACSNASTSAKSSTSGRAPTCSYVAKLDEITKTVAAADVHDPDTFNKTLKTAVTAYVTNLRELRAVAPADLDDALDRVRADVQQYRFDAALTDRAALDAYASRTCGRVAQTSTPTTLLGGSTRVVAGSTTTTVTGPASTTVASGTTTSTSFAGG